MRVGYYVQSSTKTKVFILSCLEDELQRLQTNSIDGPLKITFNRGLLTVRPSDHGGGPAFRFKRSFYQVQQSLPDARANPARLDAFAFTDVPASAQTMDHGCLIIDLNAFEKVPVRPYTKEKEPDVATSIHSFADLKSVPAPVSPPPTPEVTPEPVTVQVKVPQDAGKIDEERLSELLWELNGMIDRHEDLDLFINDDNHLVAEITIRKRIGG
jgi:hypothetical protein